MVVFSHVASLLAQEKQQKEALVRAAYIYNFCLFVEWPQTAFHDKREEIVVGIAGRDSFIDIVTDAVRDKTAQGRTFKVIRINSITDAMRTQVLFLGFPETEKNESYIAALRYSPIMTVGDDPKFAEKGGVIRLFSEQGSVRYEINLASAKSAHIEFQSRLLSMARITGRP